MEAQLNEVLASALGWTPLMQYDSDFLLAWLPYLTDYILAESLSNNDI